MNVGGKLHAQAALIPGKNAPLLIAYEACSRPSYMICGLGGLGASEGEKSISTAGNRIIMSLSTSP